MVDLHDEFRDTLLFNRARIDRRAADALTGLAAGLIADGVVSQQEAEFLESWIAQNMAHIDDPVINILYGRLQAMLKDGVLDQEEAAELLKMLQSFAGVRHSPAVQRSLPSSFSCDLPLNQPPPLITVENQMFLFTGVMAFGPRRECEAQITARGWVIAASVRT